MFCLCSWHLSFSLRDFWVQQLKLQFCWFQVRRLGLAWDHHHLGHHEIRDELSSGVSILMTWLGSSAASTVLCKFCVSVSTQLFCFWLLSFVPNFSIIKTLSSFVNLLLILLWSWFSSIPILQTISKFFWEPYFITLSSILSSAFLIIVHAYLNIHLIIIMGKKTTNISCFLNNGFSLISQWNNSRRIIIKKLSLSLTMMSRETMNW